jgi:lipopolysaccharide/colanic/teichoic acid biosynthesis glycosyltransferase
VTQALEVKTVESTIDTTPFSFPDHLLAAEIVPVSTRGLLQLLAKRSFDIVGGLLALLALIPAFLVIAIAIKLDSPGPVFFTQRRIGRNGRPFAMLKFRTMIDGADTQKLRLLHLNEHQDGLFKITDDPRVTRLGSHLRSTSLDELPQLIDVIFGSMSLVGPRPLVAEEDALIGGPLRRRLEMRPGMTGPWQVAGASRLPMGVMTALDYEYVDSQSFAGDIGLIVRTVPHVLKRRGA